MDRWLERVEADTSNDPLPAKIARNRPPEAADGCFEAGRRAEAKACASFSVDDDPRLVAGMPDARDILKCQLKPLNRSDYRVTFTDGQWDRLNQVFPAGVCDWSKPGVGQQPNAPWLTYGTSTAHVFGGAPLGATPRSVPCQGRLRMRVRSILGARRIRGLRSATIYVNGKRWRRVRGARLRRPLVVKRLSGTSVRVTVIARGRRNVTRTRVYRLCGRA
jgi:hypothetical protein